MNMNYSFLENKEPSDRQLMFLMKEVSEEVKRKAESANKEFFRQLHEMVMEVIKGKNDKISD